MSDKLLNPLIALVDRGQPDLAEQEVRTQINTLFQFLLGLYHSGRIQDYGEDEINIARMAFKVKRTADNVANLIFLLNRAGKRDEAVGVFNDYKHIVENCPKGNDIASVYYNYGVVLMEQGKLKEAADAFRGSRSRNPQCVMTHYQLSNVLMAIGDYGGGLLEDQWRFEAHSQLKKFRKRFFPKPDWLNNGEKHRVLVFSEQGLGDAIFCARYLKELKETGCRVLLEVQNELTDVFRGLADEVYGRQGDDFTSPPAVSPESYDSVVSINSLPFYLDRYLMSPATDKYIDPRAEIPPTILLHKRPLVGLVWAGSRFHTNDRERSCPLKFLAPLFDVKGVTLLNFQQGEMERTWCRGNSTLWDGDENYDVVNLVEDAEPLLAKMDCVVRECKSFFETALLLRQLDLLITVDTALAHLAGAMGVRTWLLLPCYHEWRWRKDWYTSVKYFRQEQPGDWTELAGRVAKNLADFKIGVD